LSEKGQSQATSHEVAMEKMVAELERLKKDPRPALIFVGAFLFTCYESG
jgi:hypothetical protein